MVKKKTVFQFFWRFCVLLGPIELKHWKMFLLMKIKFATGCNRVNLWRGISWGPRPFNQKSLVLGEIQKLTKTVFSWFVIVSQ